MNEISHPGGSDSGDYDPLTQRLMVHVERIVRPVRASEHRKLRMRRELLAHLESAFDQERAQAPDDAAALERADQRLGNAQDLTRQLQKSVPLLERMITARIPGFIAAHRAICGPDVPRGWFLRLYAPFDGMRDVHALIVFVLALFVASSPFICAICVWIFGPSMPGLRGHVNEFAFTELFISQLLFVLILHFMTTLARPLNRARIWQSFALGAGVAGAQMAVVAIFAPLVPFMPPNRALSARYAVPMLCTTLVLALVARAIALHRRPYDQWLALSLSE
jgi:hypothetical protein